MAPIVSADVVMTILALIACVAVVAAMHAERKRRIEAESLATRYRTELAHASRLVTVGELTASIAHEINQPLGAILSNAEAAEMLLQRANPPIDEVRQILADVRADDMRATKVIRQLRALLGKQELELRELPLNEVIVETVSLVRGAAGRAEQRIELELQDDLPPVLGDRTQLQQVLLNLLLNAMDASQGMGGEARRIVVRTVFDDNSVSCIVLDRGRGLRRDEQVRAFESFYTTKPHGLGLGLPIVRTIIDRHNGSVSITNREDGGVAAAFAVPALQTNMRTMS